MHVFVYEWVTGGGMLGCEGPLVESWLVEGLAMVRAVGEDFSSLPDTRVSLLRDLRVAQLVARGCQIYEVDSAASHNQVFATLCREADVVMLIAPETDATLLRAAECAETYGTTLISPSTEFICVAGDKHQTAERLHQAGVPAPKGVVVEPEQPLPTMFSYPAVLKPLDGAGSQDTLVVASHHDCPPAYAWPRRLEEYVAGLPVSVSLLCGPGGATPLAPSRQRLSCDGTLRYLGGETPLAAGLAKRATQLALAALDAMPPCVGYVGVDLVLGSDPDGLEDCVIEVNPRLTTSYVGLRQAAEENLAGAMLAVAKRQPAKLTFQQRGIEFFADGVVSYLDP